MATTSENMDYSFSKDETLIIHNQNTENKSIEENIAGPSSVRSRACSVEPLANREKLNINEAIAKVENILQELKKQRGASPAEIRIVRDLSKKRPRKSRTKFASNQRYDSSSESSSPSPKRTRKESPRKKYDSDSSISKDDRSRESSLCSLNSNKPDLQKELSDIGNSFGTFHPKRSARKFKRRSRSLRRSVSHTRHPRRDYDSYDRHTKKQSSRTHSDQYINDFGTYQYMVAHLKTKCAKYDAVMYAFSTLMEVLRQDDMYTNY